MAYTSTAPFCSTGAEQPREPAQHWRARRLRTGSESALSLKSLLGSAEAANMSDAEALASSAGSPARLLAGTAAPVLLRARVTFTDALRHA